MSSLSASAGLPPRAGLGVSISPRPSYAPAAAGESRLRVRAQTAGDALAWAEFVANAEDATVFHGLPWQEGVASAFGHEPHYLIAEQGGAVAGVLPLFLVRSRIAGRLLVSVPYAVGGGVLAADPLVRRSLVDRALGIARESRCRCIDLRSETAAVAEWPVCDRYVTFRRELPQDPRDVLGWLPRKARAAARNGREKFGLSFETGPQHLATVWRLYTINMRRLGSICYPYRFFEALHAAMPEHTWVSLVQRGCEPVAGLVSFVFKRAIMPYFFGGSGAAQRCSAANYAYFALAERAAAAGLRTFDFGRTRRDNQGSFDFKRFHGFEPRPLGYQRYALPGCVEPDLRPGNPAFSLARRVWKRLPLWITQAAGARLARHIPG